MFQRSFPFSFSSAFLFSLVFQTYERGMSIMSLPLTDGVTDRSFVVRILRLVIIATSFLLSEYKHHSLFWLYSLGLTSYFSYEMIKIFFANAFISFSIIDDHDPVA